MKSLKLAIIQTKFLGNWSTQNTVHKNIVQNIYNLFSNVTIIDPFFEKINVNDFDYLIITPKENSKLLFHFLSSLKSRPPIIFFLGAEGTRMGANLGRFKSIFNEKDKFLVACESEKKILQKLFGKNFNVNVCPYPVSTFFKPENSFEEPIKLKKDWALRNQLNLASEFNWLMYVGRINEQKNIFNLLKLLEKSEDTYLFIAGKMDLGPSFSHVNFKGQLNFEEKFQKEILIKKLYERIFFLGELSQEKIKDLMRVSDCQISLSSYYAEDFGQAIADGIAFGLPTFLSDWGGHKNWKHFENVEYCKLSFDENLGYCTPKIDDFLLPKKLSTENFFLKINLNFKDTLMNIIEDQNDNFIELTSFYENFWKKRNEDQSPYLFNSINEEELIEIRNIYLN